MDYREELERVEQSISYIEDAIEYLRLAGSMDDVIAELTDRQDALKETRETIRRKVEMEDDREEAALEREYYAAVL